VGGSQFSCGGGCIDTQFTAGLPGWTIAAATGGGQIKGQFPQIDPYPNGIAAVYLNVGSISQTLAATAQAGTLYTLQVDFGFRTNHGNPGFANLVVNGHSAPAVGVPAQLSGDWVTYTAVYLATAADAGAAISIVLGSPTVQAWFDNVRVDAAAAVPVPAALPLFATGLAALGLLARRRRKQAA
jgi:hypothetical protein